ncbi:hypothetical protein Gotri_018132 [Gossypium trilobum]|uniref:RNase H type-1 domain-containing protein n=1 Tax=Gossypium trilobum TaxID=34281 RepID=A0A7J9EA22_9ROSI|nr:hypothetical protein [Gossypium trilobum]
MDDRCSLCGVEVENMDHVLQSCIVAPVIWKRLDWNAKWIVESSRFVGSCSTLEAKLWGVVEGLRLAWWSGQRRVILELDNMDIVSMLTSSA